MFHIEDICVPSHRKKWTNSVQNRLYMNMLHSILGPFFILEKGDRLQE